jgi:hypothetical protein
LAISEIDGESIQKIKYLYPVLNVVLKPRSKIPTEVNGRIDENLTNDKYWLFTLGRAIALTNDISKTMDKDHFEFKITDIQSLHKVNNWQSIEHKYLVGNVN